MHLLAELQPADLGLLDVGLDPDLVGIVQQQDALAGLDVFARQHEGAVDHRRHRAAGSCGPRCRPSAGASGPRGWRPDGRAPRSARRSRPACHARPAPRRGCPRPARAPPAAAGSGSRACHRGLRRLELALVDHAALANSDAVALELQLGEIEIGLAAPPAPSRAPRRADVRVRISASAWFMAERALGAQPRALGPDALDLRAQGIGLQLGHAIVDAGHHLAGRRPACPRAPASPSPSPRRGWRRSRCRRWRARRIRRCA